MIDTACRRSTICFSYHSRLFPSYMCTMIDPACRHAVAQDTVRFNRYIWTFVFLHCTPLSQQELLQQRHIGSAQESIFWPRKSQVSVSLVPSNERILLHKKAGADRRQRSALWCVTVVVNRCRILKFQNNIAKNVVNGTKLRWACGEDSQNRCSVLAFGSVWAFAHPRLGGAVGGCLTCLCCGKTCAAVHYAIDCICRPYLSTFKTQQCCTPNVKKVLLVGECCVVIMVRSPTTARAGKRRGMCVTLTLNCTAYSVVAKGHCIDLLLLEQKCGCWFHIIAFFIM